jgi:signal transduction histidine kinase
MAVERPGEEIGPAALGWWNSHAMRFALAGLLPLLSVGARIGVDRVLPIHSYYGLFYPVVALSAYYLGFGCAIVTVAASILLNSLIPSEADASALLFQMLLFVFVSGIIIRLADLRNRATEQAGEAWTHTDEQKRELLHARDELAASNRSLQQFTAAAAHDLKQPLSNLVMTVMLLDQACGQSINDEARGLVADAVAEGQRLGRMVDGLLRLSRAGAAALNREQVPLEVPVQQAMIALSPAIKECDARITCENLPTVSADPVLLTQVFQNLLANAIKFRHPVGCDIVIDARRRDGDWQIGVRDNGIGFDPNKARRVFDVFARLPEHQSYDGTGIGLAICKQIVERHGGRIWAESSPGLGSTFYFTLPT